MSTVRFNGLVLEGAAYLIRLDVNLDAAHLQIRDIDVHVLAHLQNQSASELIRGMALVGRGDLEIEAYDDGLASHQFQEIEFSGRLAVRTPEIKLALLKFRYTAAGVAGWADTVQGLSRIHAIFPTAHAAGAIYPAVALQNGAAVHQIGLAGPSRDHDPASEVIAHQPRRVVGFFTEEHPDNTGTSIVPVKLGLASYRTNYCRWLDLIVHQDAHWRAHAAGNVAGNIPPIDLTITNPDGNHQLTLQLENMNGGQLLYAEAGGEIAGARELLNVAHWPAGAPAPQAGKKPEDRWELYNSANIPGATLGDVSLAHLPGLVPMTGRDLSLAGLQQGAAGPNTPPVEQVILKFSVPNPPTLDLTQLLT